MLSRFQLTNAAKSDLAGIAEYTEQHWGVEQRDKYLAQLDSMFHQLAENPGLGRACDYIKPGYRKFPVSSHVIYYQTHPGQITVVRVLHKNMDVSESIHQH